MTSWAADRYEGLRDRLVVIFDNGRRIRSGGSTDFGVKVLVVPPPKASLAVSTNEKFDDLLLVGRLDKK